MTDPADPFDASTRADRDLDREPTLYRARRARPALSAHGSLRRQFEPDETATERALRRLREAGLL